jgi:hypothetical protein
MARKENENEKPHRKKINIKWKREKVWAYIGNRKEYAIYFHSSLLYMYVLYSILRKKCLGQCDAWILYCVNVA